MVWRARDSDPVLEFVASLGSETEPTAFGADDRFVYALVPAPSDGSPSESRRILAIPRDRCKPFVVAHGVDDFVVLPDAGRLLVVDREATRLQYIPTDWWTCGPPGLD